MKPARIAAVIAKESREILRDPVTIGVALLMPLVMLFLFGYAISLDIDDVAMGGSIATAARPAAPWCSVSSPAATSASPPTTAMRPPPRTACSVARSASH